MKITLIMAILLLFVSCDVSNGDKVERSQDEINCKSVECIPIARWELKSERRPLNFKAKIYIDNKLYLDECEGVAADNITISTDRRLVTLQAMKPIADEVQTMIEIQDWGTACVLPNPFYSHLDAPHTIDRVAGLRVVIFELDR